MSAATKESAPFIGRKTALPTIFHSMNEKIRLWLARKLLGTSKLQKQLVAESSTALAFVVQQVTRDCQKYSDQFFAQKLASLQVDTLAACIDANSNLSDVQKAAISTILRPPETGNMSYLG